MSTVTIPNLPAAGALTGTEVLPIVQSNITSKTTVQDIADLAGSFPYTGSAQITGSLGITGSLANGTGSILVGSYSHAEGENNATGTKNAFYASPITNGVITLSSSYGDISSTFYSGLDLLVYDTIFDNVYGKALFKMSQSYFSSPNTIIELYNTSINTTTAYVVDPIYGDVNAYGNQIIPGDYSHAEGRSTLTFGDHSTTQGENTMAVGQYAHAEGGSTKAIGYASHAEGSNTRTIGIRSHAEGIDTQAIGNNSHAEGFASKTGVVGAVYASPITNGVVTISSSYGDISSFFQTDYYLILDDSDFDNIYSKTAFIISQSYFNSTNTIVELYYTGSNTTTAYVTDTYGLSKGEITIQSNNSHAEGSNTIALGAASHAEGQNTIAAGNNSHAEGYLTLAQGGVSHAEGLGTIANRNYMHATGRYNLTADDTDYAYFVVGKGTGMNPVDRSNAFRVNSSGQCFAATTFTNGGADYAEYFESFDGTAIPLGTVVELTGSFIKPCTVAENAIGVISNKPSVLGNSDEGTADEWIGKYKKDIWGNYETIQKEFIFPAGKDEEGNITYITESMAVRVLNPDYDPTLPYIPRSQRPEWNIVGLVGQIKVLKNQPVPNRWIKMSEVSSEVDLYFVK